MEDEQFSNDDGEVSIIGASSGQRSGRHSRTENERKLLIDYDAVLVCHFYLHLKYQLCN